MMKNRLLRLVCLVFLVASLPAPGAVRAAREASETYARQLLTELTPEERVGQLFLVSFQSSSAGSDSQIRDLILNHHIGGVVLLAENDNFVDAPDTITAAYNLIAQLQTYEMQSSLGSPVDPSTGGPASIQYVPLFIGISQPGGGAPADQILTGLTPLPNLMAIGATWDPTLAGQVGEIAGSELSRLGINLFLGPSLDVLESPDATLGNELGAEVFGGDPFWVAQMGQAYIRGLHTGSEGKMLVIARNFPGRGASDRPEGEEPATVRKSLDALKQIELAPFFAVTGNAPDALATTDGLLVSHIRYQGLQGNIRATTRPVSFDAQALTQILSLPEFSAWSEAGGLLVSDDLGSETVRRFYDPGDVSFQARSVARDAFLAGNDLLYLGNIQTSGAADNYETVLSILDFFTQKYREDDAFAQQVNEAVERILAAKFALYGNFEVNNVIPDDAGLNLIGTSQEISQKVARAAATLINPGVLDVDSLIPEPPAADDQMVFLTDSRSVSQCVDCAPQAMLGVESVENAILRLYGPLAGGQVTTSRLVSYPLDALDPILDGGAGSPALESNLYSADWLIINILDADPAEPQTETLKRFLSERQDLLRNKHVILFAFDAPYYLDSTDISKLTAYYCLYSHSAPFVDVAVRILFQELSPTGSLPVSVSGADYDLFTALTPDPGQVISLSLSLPASSSATADPSSEMTPTPSFRVGDSVTVSTGVIVDHNGNPVPDGTGVTFTLSMGGEADFLQRVDAVTSLGVGRASFNINTPGLLEIRATSEPALVSVVLQMEVTGEGIAISVVTPTPEFSATTTPVSNQTPVPDNLSPLARGDPGPGGWLLMVLLAGVFAVLAYFLGIKYLSHRWGWRLGLSAGIGGVLSYMYLALRLPGAPTFIQEYQYGAIAVVALTGALIGGLCGFLWRLIERRR